MLLLLTYQLQWKAETNEWVNQEFEVKADIELWFQLWCLASLLEFQSNKSDSALMALNPQCQWHRKDSRSDLSRMIHLTIYFCRNYVWHYRSRHDHLMIVETRINWSHTEMSCLRFVAFTVRVECFKSELRNYLLPLKCESLLGKQHWPLVCWIAVRKS